MQSILLFACVISSAVASSINPVIFPRSLATGGQYGDADKSSNVDFVHSPLLSQLRLKWRLDCSCAHFQQPHADILAQSTRADGRSDTICCRNVTVQSLRFQIHDPISSSILVSSSIDASSTSAQSASDLVQITSHQFNNINTMFIPWWPLVTPRPRHTPFALARMPRFASQAALASFGASQLWDLQESR
jgi:hypothetical protein